MTLISWEAVAAGTGGLAAAALVLTLALRIRSLRAERVLMGLALVEVSDRLRAFRTDEARFREIVWALPDPVVLTDAHGATVSNASYAALLPAKPDEDGGAPRRPLAVSSGPVTIRPDGTRLVDEAVQTPGGLRSFAWSETQLNRPDGTRAVLRTGRDITDRVAAERALEEARARAEQASEAKSRFLATVSHEFRTPLSGILGMCDLLAETDLDAEQRSYVSAAKGSAEAFMSLIGEILDFSRIEAGRIDLVAEPFDVEAVVQGVAELLAPRAQDKGIEIACHVAADVPPMLVGDRDRLRQILMNLAGNAVKFTREGGVGVTVERRGGRIVFCVSDTGPGIAAERLPHIFEEFEQAGLASDREGGTGLGLAITRRIVDRMGGTIAVDSCLGEGATFRVDLDLPSAVARPSGTALPRLPADHAVLVVSPCPFGPVFHARRIVEAGGRARVAASREDAERAMASERFACVAVDWALGAADARAIAAAARRAGAERSVVLLSPFDRRSVGSAAAIGFGAHLIKPVRTRSLLERLGPEMPGDRPARRPRAAKPVRPTRTGAPRVLLAEDNEVNALLAVKSLEKLGALVDWARDGTEALARAEDALAGRRPAFDLILMDMRMPGLDGFEVTRRIRAREAALAVPEPCRIVALSASLVEGESQVRADTGFDGFLPKPFRFEAIQRELRGSEPLAAAS